MIAQSIVDEIQKKYEFMRRELDERGRRLWAASEAMTLGRGGAPAVARATGIGEKTIRRGWEELQCGPATAPSPDSRRVRRVGGGRKPLTQEDAHLCEVLERLVESDARGDPMSPLRWTSKSTRKLAEELTGQGHPVSHTKVAELLEEMDFSLQGMRKTKEGKSHPDRDAQFHYISEQVKAFQARKQPVISVDAKKKELIGDFANKGREYHRKGQPELARTYDFEDKKLGKGIPYGLLDMTSNTGWVHVGVHHDTAAFAVATIRRWWERMGSRVYCGARELLITADGGGSNGSRCKLWKRELQALADQTGLSISVCHFPPATSKWNKIEHRMFSQITENWRGRPLSSLGVMVNLIGNTTTKTGLTIHAEPDLGTYPTGVKVSDEEMRKINLVPAHFHGQDWNYTIMPRNI